MSGLHWFFSPLCALLLAPLLSGVINRTKAFVAGRRGPPLLQPYRDVIKALRRGAVYGDTTTALVRLGPVVNLAALVAALLLLPFAGVPAVAGFSGDLIVLVGLLALGRFATVLAALDTGASFEGMGASREVHFAALAEPALLLALATLTRVTGATSLSAIYAVIGVPIWAHALPTLALVAMTFLVLELVENSRIPVDDPTTHLELTMIHEVMVLDHTGPDLAIIQYGAALKLWVLGVLLVGLAVPVRTGNPWLDGAAALAGMTGLAIVVGIVESAMARYRLVHVPQFIVGAATLAAVGFIVLLV
ncbi:MAG TPA: NADH-quinone oxidoreductase subunit H [Stellaceae bacterium]|nr:NADH-quinone oxidoreductase subunit H [Stellaceae bacterium]